MNRVLIGLAAALALASTTAYAATPELSKDDATQLCTRLDTQFKALKPFKEGLPYWQKAAEAHKSGEQACDNGKPVVGAQSMRTAISDLYVKPDTL
ncbi:MAG: hypothetical protein K8R18_00885 [Parvibaculum sp.]|uniref:hypothetical protein n=1 Tax=Parvibaculum sp. TaxID=2024848 RepID=UPI0025E52597|nr:hypothetical protein [Parvibaculum sp.]MCE9648152.1 hypothetical protein [Parvibaculum sp.]